MSEERGLARRPLLAMTTKRSQISNQNARGTAGFETVVLSAIFVCALYFGKALLLPLALAIFLTFLLSPVVDAMRRIHVPKILAVSLATLGSVAILLSVAVILGQQVRTFAEDLPRYQYVLSEKIHVLKDLVATKSTFARTGETLKALRDEILGPAPGAPASTSSSAKPAAPEPDKAEPPAALGEAARPVTVVVDDRKSALDRLLSTAEVAAGPLATGGIAIVFMIVLLLDRADVRDRAIRLFGTADLERTTRAMDDAGQRLKRYFVTTSAVNFTFGTVMGIGLWFIGIPNPILWGVIAMVMRFIPFVGIWLAAALPVLLALTVDPGWTMLGWTLGLFIVGEILVSQLVEPYIQGESTGLSFLAIILATAFWTLLWGPAGLLLAVPLTVMLVVVGRHIERFRFFDILFGSEPALSPADSVYQRILAGDPEEAADQAQAKLKDMTTDAFYDTVVMSALSRAASDLLSGRFDGARTAEIGAAFDEFIEDIGELSRDVKKDDEALPVGALLPGQHVVCLAARTVIDRAGATVLAQLLDDRGISAVVATPEELLHGPASDHAPALISVSAFNATERSAQLKFLIRKLRRRYPEAEIIGGFWLADTKQEANMPALENIGASEIAATFADAINQIILTSGGTGTLLKRSPEPVTSG